MHPLARTLAAASLVAILAGPAGACGVETDCVIGERSYRISLPEGHGTKPLGAVIYAHGYRGSAAGAMKNAALRSAAHAEGLAFVATKSATADWLVPGVPEDPAADGTIELDYYDAVVDDLARRFGIDRTRLIATGFSAGAMMVWNLACHRSETFAAFVPISGTFWEPMPESCPSEPVNLIHIHGTADKVVPLEGRPIKVSRQGSVPEALAMMARTGGYRADGRTVEGALSCEHARTPGGALLSFCTHPGGHSMRTEFLATAIGMLKERGRF